jgi:hypothetical protein
MGVLRRSGTERLLRHVRPSASTTHFLYGFVLSHARDGLLVQKSEPPTPLPASIRVFKNTPEISPEGRGVHRGPERVLGMVLYAPGLSPAHWPHERAHALRRPLVRRPRERMRVWVLRLLLRHRSGGEWSAPSWTYSFTLSASHSKSSS